MNIMLNDYMSFQLFGRNGRDLFNLLVSTVISSIRTPCSSGLGRRSHARNMSRADYLHRINNSYLHAFVNGYAARARTNTKQSKVFILSLPY